MDYNRAFDWAMSGVVAGLAFYFYAGARLTLVVLIAVLIWPAILQPRQLWRQYGFGVWVMSGAFLITAAPMLQYAFRFPDDFNARLNQVGIIQSGWLVQEMGVRGQGVLSILLDQFQRAALAFNFYPDRTVWYGLPQPLLDPLFGSLFLVGMGLALLYGVWPGQDRRWWPPLAWWWAGVILGGMLTESPPSSQRLVSLSVPVCFFVAVAVWELGRLLARVVWQGGKRPFLIGMVLLFAVNSLLLYFADYTPQRIYGGARAEFATTLTPLLQEVATDRVVYFVGAPWMYGSFATLPYLAPDVTIVDIEEPLDSAVSNGQVQAGQQTVFVFVPERLSELDVARRIFPDGHEVPIASAADGQLLGVLYITEPFP